MGGDRLLTSRQFQLVQVLQIVGSTLSLITVTAALSAHVHRTTPAIGPRKVMHKLVSFLFFFDMLFSLSLFAGPFVYNTSVGCQAIAALEVVFSSSLIVWNLLIALYSLLMLKRVKQRKVLDNECGVAVAAGVAVVLGLVQSVSLYTRGMLGRAVTNCWIVDPREQMYHFYVPLGLVWIAVTAISIRLLWFLAHIPKPSQNTTAAVVNPMQRQAVAFSLCFLAVFLIPVTDRAFILTGHRPPVQLLVLLTFFISLRGFFDALIFSRFGGSAAKKDQLPVARRRLGPAYTSTHSERLLPEGTRRSSLTFNLGRNHRYGLRGLPTVTQLAQPQDKQSEEEGGEAGGLLPPSVALGIFATTVIVPPGRVGDGTTLPPPHEWLPSPSASSYHTYVIAALTEGHDPSPPQHEQARQQDGEVKTEGETWQANEGGPLPAETLHAIWAYLSKQDYVMWHREAQEGQARASLTLFVRACDVEAGEMVKMSHMATATHTTASDPPQPSSAERDGASTATEGSLDTRAEACGVGVVVRYWDTCVAFICAACSAPLAEGGRSISLRPTEGPSASWGLQEVLSQLDLTPSACLQTTPGSGSRETRGRPKGGHVSNTYLTAYHTMLLLGKGREAGGDRGPTTGKQPARRRRSLPRFKLSLRSFADALRWFVTPQPLCGSCNVAWGWRQEETPAMWPCEAGAGGLYRFVGEGDVLVHSLLERQGQLYLTPQGVGASAKAEAGLRESEGGDLETGGQGQRDPEDAGPEGRAVEEWGRRLGHTDAATSASGEGVVIRSTPLSLLLRSPISCPLALPCRLRLGHLHTTWLDAPLPSPSTVPRLGKMEMEQEGPASRSTRLRAMSSQFSRRGDPGAMFRYALSSASPSDLRQDPSTPPPTGTSRGKPRSKGDEEEQVDVAVVFPLPAENAALQARAPSRARQPPPGLVVWTPMGPPSSCGPGVEAAAGKGGRKGAAGVVMELRTQCYPALGLHALILVRSGKGQRMGQALVSLSGMLASQVAGWVEVKHVPVVRGGTLVGFLDCRLQLQVQLDGSGRRAMPVGPGEVSSSGRGGVGEAEYERGAAATAWKAAGEGKGVRWTETQGEGTERGRVEEEELRCMGQQGWDRDAEKLQARGQSAGAAWGRAGDEKDGEEMAWARANSV